MLTIRLVRRGKKNHPSFRIVVMDHRKAPQGKILEKIGFYNPLFQPAKFEIKKDRLDFWLKRGAKVTTTIANFIKNNLGITLKKDQIRKKRKAKKKKIEKKTIETPVKETKIPPPEIKEIKKEEKVDKNQKPVNIKSGTGK